MLAIALKYGILLSVIVGILAAIVLAVLPTITPSQRTKGRVPQGKKGPSESRKQKKKPRSQPFTQNEGPSSFRGPPAKLADEERQTATVTSLSKAPKSKQSDLGASQVPCKSTSNTAVAKSSEIKRKDNMVVDSKKNGPIRSKPAEKTKPVEKTTPVESTKLVAKPKPKMGRTEIVPTEVEVDDEVKAAGASAKKAPKKGTTKTVTAVDRQGAHAKVTSKVVKPEPANGLPSIDLPHVSSASGENDPSAPNQDLSKAGRRKAKSTATTVEARKGSKPADPLGAVPGVQLTTNSPGVVSIDEDDDVDQGEFMLVRSRKEQHKHKKLLGARGELEDPDTVEPLAVSRPTPVLAERVVEKVVAPKWFTQIPKAVVAEPRASKIILFGADLTDQWEAPLFNVPTTFAPVAVANDAIEPETSVPVSCTPFPKAPPPKPAPWSAMVTAPRAPVPFPLIPPDENLDTSEDPPAIPPTFATSEETFGRSQNEPPSGSIEVGFWS